MTNEVVFALLRKGEACASPGFPGQPRSSQRNNQLIKEQELTIYIDDDYKEYIKNDNFKIKELYWK